MLVFTCSSSLASRKCTVSSRSHVCLRIHSSSASSLGVLRSSGSHCNFFRIKFRNISLSSGSSLRVLSLSSSERGSGSGIWALKTPEHKAS